MDGGSALELLLSGDRDVVLSASPLLASRAGAAGGGPWAKARVRRERALQADQMFNRGGMLAAMWWDRQLHPDTNVAVATLQGAVLKKLREGRGLAAAGVKRTRAAPGQSYLDLQQPHPTAPLVVRDH